MLLRGRRYDDEVKEIQESTQRMPGERIRKIGQVCINREEFRHTEHEKLRLKEEKAKYKREQMRKLCALKKSGLCMP
jgi:hypothetical protein